MTNLLLIICTIIITMFVFLLGVATGAALAMPAERGPPPKARDPIPPREELKVVDLRGRRS
ncbi:MAG: hypothetical protein EBR82_71250 [Caulobacteraceae bacterium]|nr:hypothetical protein [Caulobacteraceae bacterium]